VSWLDATDVATFLETVEDDQLRGYTDAVRGEVERVRSDLDFTAVPDPVRVGAMLWVKSLAQARMAPSGFPAYGDPGGDVYAIADSSRWVEIVRLIGLRRPVVA
jgi:hypothetical protein